MTVSSRLQSNEKKIEKGIDYAKASLGMEGLHLSKDAEKLIRQYGHGEITEKELFEQLGSV